MQLKQSAEEFDKIQSQLTEVLKPAQLDWKKNSNVLLIASWVADRFTTNGVTDASFENMRKAVYALKANLSWVVPPKSQDPRPVLSAETKGLRNHAQPQEEYKPDPSKDVIGLMRKAALTEAAEQMFGDCLREIQTFQGRTHGATARGREILKSILDKALSGGGDLNPAVAADTLDKIKARLRTLYDEC